MTDDIWNPESISLSWTDAFQASHQTSRLLNWKVSVARSPTTLMNRGLVVVDFRDAKTAVPVIHRCWNRWVTVAVGTRKWFRAAENPVAAQLTALIAGFFAALSQRTPGFCESKCWRSAVSLTGCVQHMCVSTFFNQKLGAFSGKV